MALGQQLHILLRHMDAVRRDHGHVEHMMAVEHLRGRQTVFLHARVVFLLRLGQVHLQLQAVVDGILRQRVPELIRRGIFGMDGGFNFNAAIVIVVPLVLKCNKLLAGREGIEAEVVSQEHGRAAGDIGLDAGFGYSLADLVAEVIHIRHARRAEAQRLGKGKRCRRLDGAAVEPVLARENIVLEPVLQIQIVDIAAQQVHGQMRVAVDEARHQDHAGRVNNLLRLLLRRLFRHIGDLAVGDADKRILPERHLLVHRNDVDMRKQGVHGSPPYGFCSRSPRRIEKISSFCCRIVSMREI